MTEFKPVKRVWKRLHCPKCSSLVRTRYATDGTWILQDSKPTLKDVHDENETGVFTQAQEIALGHIIRKIVAKMDEEGFFNYDHSE